MTTDVHSVPADPEAARLSIVFWACVVVAVCAALLKPFMPPHALVDATHEAR